MNNLT